MTEPTSKIRALDSAPAVGDSHDSIPMHRSRREDSGTLAKAVVEQVDHVMRQKLKAGLATDVKSVIADELAVQMNRLARRLTEDQSERSVIAPRVGMHRSVLPWALSIFLGVALVVGALVATWDKINRVEERQDDAENYAGVVANWLVVSAEAEYTHASNLDQMMRIIAAHVGADVSSVPPPVKQNPPTPVQRKHADFKISKGE